MSFSDESENLGLRRKIWIPAFDVQDNEEVKGKRGQANYTFGEGSNGGTSLNKKERGHPSADLMQI